MKTLTIPLTLFAAIIGLEPLAATADHQRTSYRRAISVSRHYQGAFQVPAYAPSYGVPEYGSPSYGYPPQGPYPGEVEAAVRDMYVNYLGREPDPLGHVTWVNHVYSGAPLIEAQAGILSSVECFARNQYDPERYVRFIFRQALGREASQQQVQTWTRLFHERYYGNREAFCGDLLLSGGRY